MAALPKGWCSQCGDPWAPGQTVCKKCGAKPEQMKVCVRCPNAFTYLHPVMNFCPFCGNREILLPGASPPATATAPPATETKPTAPPTLVPPVQARVAPKTEEKRIEPPAAVVVPTPVPKPSASELRQQAIDEITRATGLSFLRARRLFDSGYDVPKLRIASVEELTKIQGVDDVTARRLLEALGVEVKGIPPMAKKANEESEELGRTIDRLGSEGVLVEPVRDQRKEAMTLNAQGKHEEALVQLAEARSLLNEVVESDIRSSREKMLVRMSMSSYKKADTKELREVLANIDVALSIGDYEEALQLKRKGLKLVGEG
ncbi:MAG TPA: hypothetical protein VI893_01455 [Thermoplasmata archaeon]|nr:hypothetical protein [Thermoplasmata archaeon]